MIETPWESGKLPPRLVEWLRRFALAYWGEDVELTTVEYFGADDRNPDRLLDVYVLRGRRSAWTLGGTPAEDLFAVKVLPQLSEETFYLWETDLSGSPESAAEWQHKRRGRVKKS